MAQGFYTAHLDARVPDHSQDGDRAHTYLLIEAVRGQVEVVQGYEVIFQEPHEQHQVHPICKLEERAR